MELENNILNEITQTQKNMYNMYSLVSGYQLKKKKGQNNLDTVHRTQKLKDPNKDVSGPLGREKKAITRWEGERKLKGREEHDVALGGRKGLKP